jgi:hypothetical protein
MTWVLVLYIYAGMLAKGDSVTISNITGFTTEASCAAAGNKSKELVGGSAKEARFVCVAVK